MDDKEILVLLEHIEDEGVYARDSRYGEDWSIGVCPYCHQDIEEHLSDCQLVKAISALKERLNNKSPD